MIEMYMKVNKLLSFIRRDSRAFKSTQKRRSMYLIKCSCAATFLLCHSTLGPTIKRSTKKTRERPTPSYKIYTRSAFPLWTVIQRKTNCTTPMTCINVLEWISWYDILFQNSKWPLNQQQQQQSLLTVTKGFTKKK